MIRIITERDKDGNPTGWSDYPGVRVDEVSMLHGLQFDRDLADLARDGIDVGVTRWSEAQWRIKTFSAESYLKLKQMCAELTVEDTDATYAMIAERPDFMEWTETHPTYPLMRMVVIWSAVVEFGGQMTLRDILNLAPADVEDYIDNDFIDAEAVPGKG